MRRFPLDSRARSVCFVLAALTIIASWTGELRGEIEGGRPEGVRAADAGALHARGFVPPKVHIPSLRPGIPVQAATELPSRFDWREQGKVTPVRDQSTCGSCYAFAATANVEARLLVAGEPRYDFSENNVKECEWYESSCEGGNFFRVANYLSQKGTVLETCDPYAPYNVPCKSTCPYVLTLLGWKLISGDTVPDPEVIKSYVYTYGPVYTSFYAGGGDSWGSEMRNYDGSYTLYYDGNDTPNHAVLIVGWDDNLTHAGGKGAWIVKNSWGTGWGGACGYGTQRGFFTMGYGSARIGNYTSFMSDWKEYDPDERLLYYDEGGYSKDIGDFGSTTGWGMCKFIPDENIRIERVEFWTTDATTDVDVYIYDDFTGGVLSGLLAAELDSSFGELGYYSVELSTPITVEAGNDIYAAVKFSNVSFEAPIPLDSEGTPEPAMCFISTNGTAWQNVKVLDGHASSDVCIRLRGVEVESSHTWRVPGDAETIAQAVYRADAGDTVLVGPGTYSESSILIEKSLVIVGEAGPESTFISPGGGALGSPTDGCITFKDVGASAVLRGFTLDGVESSTTPFAILIRNASPRIEECMIIRTNSPSGACINVDDGQPLIRNCTLNDNRVFSAIYFGPSTGGSVERSIITGTTGGSTFSCLTGANPLISCCDVYGNSGGDDICGTDGGGNFSLDPLFCDATSGDYSLQDGSPCLWAGDCGRVGALGQGCPTEAPLALDSFAATSGDASNLLEWTLPAAPVQGAYIVYSTGGYPSGPGEGSPVENGDDGYFAGWPSAEMSFTHKGLDNGTTYYYSAYAYNGGLLSDTPLNAAGTPQDTVPPAPPSGLTAAGDRGMISLSWTYPPDEDLEGVAIRYSTVSYPETYSEGNPVENGASGIFTGAAGTDTSFAHSGLTDGEMYYYSAFAFDEVPYYSEPARVSAAAGDNIPPGEVSGFEVVKADSALHLKWTNPVDPDFEGVLIRYSTGSYPAGPADGTAVENGASGRFYGEAAAADSFTHLYLVNGQTYYYTVFTFDSEPNYSAGATGTGSPADETPPAGVTTFSAVAGDNAVTLRWENPADEDFMRTVIRYSTASYPLSPLEGIAVENGDEGRFYGMPAGVDSFSHTGLTNNTVYFYAAFAGDEVPNYSGPVDASAVPVDVVPPPRVAAFSAAAGDSCVRLRWTNAEDADLDGVAIRYSTSGYPETAEAGDAVENGSGGNFDAQPAAPDSFLHFGLANETRYYYSIFGYDEVPNLSERDTVSVVPYDQTPPGLTVRVFQNPYLSSHLDIYVIATEALSDTSLFCMVGETPVGLEISDNDANVFRGDYVLRSDGNLSILVSARDLRGNSAKATRDFGACMLTAAAGGRVVSHDGKFAACIDCGALADDVYVTIFESEPGEVHFETPGVGKVYRMSPLSCIAPRYFEISIEFDEGASHPQHLAIARMEGNSAVPLESYIDRESNRAIAFVDRFASYALVCREGKVTPDYGTGHLKVLQSFPNPFRTSTDITFEIPLPSRVTVDIISVEGRLVRSLVEDRLPPGRQNVTWDGCDSEGNPLGSGLYLYRIRTESGAATDAATGKLIILR